MILHGNIYLWLVMKKSSVSRTRRFYVGSDSVFCLGKMNENPQSNTVCEDKYDVVQEFITIQNFGHNWWCANGIRVEYFPRIHHIAALQQKAKSSCQKWAIHQNNLKYGSSSCRCSMTSSWGSEDNEQECESKRQTRFYLCEKIFHQEDGHS